MVPEDCRVAIVVYIDDTWPDTLQRSHTSCTFQLSDAPDDAFGGDTQVKPQRMKWIRGTWPGAGLHQVYA